MILVDTSAWIEFLRDTGSSVCDRVEVLIQNDIAGCDAIRMEVLAGARNERHLRNLRGLLARTTVLPTGSGDYDDAAALYRACRREGESVRKLRLPHWLDCHPCGHCGASQRQQFRRAGAAHRAAGGSPRLNHFFGIEPAVIDRIVTFMKSCMRGRPGRETA